METVVSGIRPTGNLHLGNYFGAVKNFLKMQGSMVGMRSKASIFSVIID